VASAVILLAASLISLTASAEVYRWVDPQGRVNYSDHPPAEKLGTNTPVLVQDRVSVYTPSPALAQAAAAFRQDVNNSRGLAAARRDGEQLAQQRALVASRGDPCAYSADGCGNGAGDYYPGYPLYPVAAVARRNPVPFSAGGHYPMRRISPNRPLRPQ
jgi:hypothetical protein